MKYERIPPVWRGDEPLLSYSHDFGCHFSLVLIAPNMLNHSITVDHIKMVVRLWQPSRISYNRGKLRIMLPYRSNMLRRKIERSDIPFPLKQINELQPIAAKRIDFGTNIENTGVFCRFHKTMEQIELARAAYIRESCEYSHFLSILRPLAVRYRCSPELWALGHRSVPQLLLQEADKSQRRIEYTKPSTMQRVIEICAYELQI